MADVKTLKVDVVVGKEVGVILVDLHPQSRRNFAKTSLDPSLDIPLIHIFSVHLKAF